MLGRLLRSTPFRVALLLSVAFLTALLIAAGIAQYLVRRELAARLDHSIADSFSVISQSYGDGDIADLTASVESHARTAKDNGQVFRLTNAAGRRLAGNVGPLPVPPGWSTAAGAKLGLGDDHDVYRLFQGPVGDTELVVGASLSDIDQVWTIVLAGLGWSASIFVLVVLTTGAFIAVGAQRRLDTIALAMHQVGQGNLSARIAVRDRGDDIDRLAGTVNAALDRLAALVEGMRQVSVDIAHDLKTPLNRLAITIENAKGAEGPALAELLGQAEGEAAQINATFEALLRIAQIEAGARRARFDIVDLVPLLETIVEVYEDLAAQRGQQLVLSPGPATAPILGDKELLIQLFANLVENGLRHSPAGTDVDVTVRVEPGATTIVVADTGPGIPPVERTRVFRRLYRLDKSRNTPGSGLGLSLVKAIADLHGATISLADNDPGLLVTIRFPGPQARSRPDHRSPQPPLTEL